MAAYCLVLVAGDAFAGAYFDSAKALDDDCSTNAATNSIFCVGYFRDINGAYAHLNANTLCLPDISDADLETIIQAHRVRRQISTTSDEVTRRPALEFTDTGAHRDIDHPDFAPEADVVAKPSLVSEFTLLPR